MLVRHLDVPLLGVLDEALTSHRYALDIDPDNADTLFNTAQVLVTIAEELAKDDSRVGDVLRILEEALELQARCLSIQELRFEESEQQRRAMAEEATAAAAASTVAEPPAASPTTASNDRPPSSAAEDQWFSILEPVTHETLIDTILAQIGTLTTLCSVLATTDPLPPAPALSWIGEYPEVFFHTKLPAYALNAPPATLQEIALAKANFVSRLLEAGFRHGSVDAETYQRERDAAFALPELQLPTSAPARITNAESLLAYASALAEGTGAAGFPFAARRWQALSGAVTNLAAAATLLPPTAPTEQLVQTHALRGDASLYLFRLGQPPASWPAAQGNAAQLLKNAEVFYRNASRLAAAEDDEGKAVAGLRSTVAQVLQGRAPEAPLGADTGQSEEWVRRQLAEMVEEGLLAEGALGASWA